MAKKKNARLGQVQYTQVFAPRPIVKKRPRTSMSVVRPMQPSRCVIVGFSSDRETEIKLRSLIAEKI